MAVPFFRLEVSEAERAAVDAVLCSGWLTTGKEASAFEEEFAAAIGEDVIAIAVNSNTAGMHLVLEACGIGPGDEVIVPTLTFTATAEVVRYMGADPVFVDVDPVTLCIDPTLLEAAITPRTKAVMPVHFGGLAADMEAIRNIASRHGLKVVEDAAHSFPATCNGTNIGALETTAAVFSFYANKTITTGEGGMILTRDKDLAKRCRVMRLHGMDRDAFARFTGQSGQWRYDVIAPGFKYNLTDIAAALGREQLRFAERKRARRQSLAMRYLAELADMPLILPASAPVGDIHAWHLFPIRLKDDARIDRDKLAEVLTQRQIGYSVHYTPLHRMTYWRDRYDLTDVEFPVSSRHADTTITLPLFSDMRDDEVGQVLQVLQEALG